MGRLSITMTFFALLLVSCDKENSDMGCIEFNQRTDWVTEDFKPGFVIADYQIQFPTNYNGTGITGFEGPIFGKERDDNKVAFGYRYCSPTYCKPFGNTLAHPEPANIIYHLNNADYDLNIKQTFCRNGVIEGLLYYNNEANSIGILYQRNDNEFKESVKIRFDNTLKQEVFDIIGTIKEN